MWNMAYSEASLIWTSLIRTSLIRTSLIRTPLIRTSLIRTPLIRTPLTRITHMFGNQLWLYRESDSFIRIFSYSNSKLGNGGVRISEGSLYTCRFRTNSDFFTYFKKCPYPFNWENTENIQVFRIEPILRHFLYL